MESQPAQPALFDQIFITASFWMLLVLLIALAFSGFWGPRNFWLSLRQPPKRQNWYFLILGVLLAYLFLRNLSQGMACTSWNCKTVFHANEPSEAWLYWQLLGLNFMLVVLMFWGFLMGQFYREDPVQQRARVDAAAAQRLQYSTEIAAAWESTGGSADFVAALAKHDLHCATDEDGMFVVVDKTGTVHPLDYAVLNETKTAIRDTLAASLKENGVTVPDVTSIRMRYAATNSKL